MTTGQPTFIAAAINIAFVSVGMLAILSINQNNFENMVNAQTKARREQEEQSRLMRMIDDMPVAVMTVDPEAFNITYANETSKRLIRKIEHLLPINSEDLLGVSIDVFHKKTSMSTRSGEFVTLRELRKEVGNDACRLFYVLRKSDQHLDFDLDLAKSQSNENPVYYIQYAHARVCSVLAQWGGEEATLAGADLAPLGNERELALCARLAEFPEVVESAAQDHAPHLIAFYLKDLAGEFHSYYNAERFLVDDEALRNARLSLCLAARQVLRNGLAIIGVGAPESM